MIGALGLGAAIPMVRVQTALADSEWILNPDNQHYYKLLTDCLTWHSCESAAIAEGAHLVAIADANEQNWLITTFGGVDLLWIGFTDEAAEGNWTWVTGEPVTFTNWAPGEPTNSGGTEHFALMNWSASGLWNDGFLMGTTRAIIERVEPPPPPPVVSGCLSLQGAPLAETRVTLRQTGELNQTVITDENGCFEFATAVSGNSLQIQLRGPVIP